MGRGQLAAREEGEDHRAVDAGESATGLAGDQSGAVHTEVGHEPGGRGAIFGGGEEGCEESEGACLLSDVSCLRFSYHTLVL